MHAHDEFHRSQPPTQQSAGEGLAEATLAVAAGALATTTTIGVTIPAVAKQAAAMVAARRAVTGRAMRRVIFVDLSY
jgi:hypothetical protein